MSRARDLSKLGNPNVIKADENSVGFGTQVAGNHANADSSLISAGIITATAYYGDGSNLEGVASAGLGTAVDDTKDSIGQNIYFTNQELSINENTTVNAPDTSSIAYTQYQQVTVESGSELIIADGDSFIPDVLGIGTALQASTAGAGNGLFGTVYADNIENAAGRGGPNFPLGITVAGVSTLSGNVSIGGTLTYEDVTNVDSIGVVTARSGIDVTAGGIDINAGGLDITGPTKAYGAGSASVEWGDTSYTGHLSYDSNNAIIRSATSKGLVFQTNHDTSNERLRISTTGAIGLAGANYGTSGQVITSQGSGAAPQWASISGGLSVVDNWGIYVGTEPGAGGGGWNNIRLGDTGNGTAGVLTRLANDNMPVGAGVTHAAGLFTFPSAGTWEITSNLKFEKKSQSTTTLKTKIVASVDGTTVEQQESWESVCHYASIVGVPYGNIQSQSVFTITNTATSNAYLNLHATNEVYILYKSNIIFKKLA